MLIIILVNIMLFQSTPSRRGRPRSKIQPHCILFNFNPLPHAEGDEISFQCKGIPNKFQSTPSRRGRQLVRFNNSAFYRISIHSLTQRETLQVLMQLQLKKISIHSLTQRETRIQLSKIIHRGISIHSLTQRETIVIR